MKTFDEALSYLLSKAIPTDKQESVPIQSALGRVLAEDITASLNVPPHNNSIMDGYALNSSDMEDGKVFTVSQRIAAGTVGEPLKSGTVARIFTGAPMPEGADTVVMQEEAELVGDGIKFTFESFKPRQNVRLIGEDIATGQVILAKGHKLRPQDLGLITSIGLGTVSVFKPLTIATFTTGDELLEPGEAAVPGKIYNANRYVLAGLVPQLGFELIDLGQVPDTLEATIESLTQAASVADVVMTTGGVSVGDEDHIKPAVEALGQLDMWKVKMKPGKPIAYGEVQGTPFIGLPGNPVSAFATFNLFARPFLLSMQGVSNAQNTPLWIKAGFEWTKAGFRRDFVRARIENVEGETHAILYPNQGSGVLTSTVWADGFVVIPEDSTVAKGDLVAYYPFNDMNA